MKQFCEECEQYHNLHLQKGQYVMKECEKEINQHLSGNGQARTVYYDDSPNTRESLLSINNHFTEGVRSRCSLVEIRHLSNENVVKHRQDFHQTVHQTHNQIYHRTTPHLSPPPKRFTSNTCYVIHNQNTDISLLPKKPKILKGGVTEINKKVNKRQDKILSTIKQQNNQLTQSQKSIHPQSTKINSPYIFRNLRQSQLELVEEQKYCCFCI